MFFKVLIACLLAYPVLAKNTQIESFKQAKEIALNKVYYDHKMTLYCGATFDENKNLNLPEGFTTPKFEKRSLQLEWEHVVPVETLGKIYKEQQKELKCYTNNGKPTQGRKCMDKVANKEYQLMQADLYNLYPSIGSVNAMRSNSPFSELSDIQNTFGSCPMKIDKHKVEPPDEDKGPVARTYLYMDEEYHQYFQMDEETKNLMHAWDEKFPPDEWECERAHRIDKIQGNKNSFVERKCA